MYVTLKVFLHLFLFVNVRHCRLPLAGMAHHTEK